MSSITLGSVLNHFERVDDDNVEAYVPKDEFIVTYDDEQVVMVNIIGDGNRLIVFMAHDYTIIKYSNLKSFKVFRMEQVL